MQRFTASVQYGDWKGTAAADNSDPMAASVDRYLKKKGLLKGGFLLAVQLFVGENHENKLSKPYIRAYVLEEQLDYEGVEKHLAELESQGEPIPVRELTIEMSLEEFVALFKRFEVMLTWHNLPLKDREYSVTNED
jgi:hypothetical protein